jgi:hypothetical protein
MAQALLIWTNLKIAKFIMMTRNMI